MIVVVFTGKEFKLYEQTPTVHEVPPYSVLCVVGKSKQKWYYMTILGWTQFNPYKVQRARHRIIKMACLMRGINYPTYNTQFQATRRTPWR